MPRSYLKCNVSTGVVTTEETDAAPWLELVELAWKEVASKKEITDVSFMFVPIKRRTEFTMDMLIEGTVTLRFYMLISRHLTKIT